MFTFVYMVCAMLIILFFVWLALSKKKLAEKNQEPSFEAKNFEEEKHSAEAHQKCSEDNTDTLADADMPVSSYVCSKCGELH